MVRKPKSVIRKIQAKELFIHLVAQRAILPSKLKALKANFDLDSVGVIHAVERTVNGKIQTEVIDGQHRVIVLKDLDLGDWPLDVKIHQDVTDDAGACRLFLHLNDRAPVSSFDKFQNELHAGLAESIAVLGLAEKHGLKVERSAGDGIITCVNALKTVCHQHGLPVLDSTLQIMLAAWGKAASALEGKLVLALALVLSRYDGSVDTAALIKKLAKFSGGPSGLIGAGLGLRSMRKANLPRCIAEAVVEAYNSGRRTHKLDPL
jgi:hypothetical protein